MLPYLATVILLVSSLLFVTYAKAVRPAVERRRTTPVAPAEPGPEPRTPRDLDRQYPRPKGGRRKLDKTCPACGTGAETTALNGKILGWPAHASCAEWLGEHWRPARPAPPPYSPDKSLIGHMERGGYGAGDLTVSEFPPPPSSVSVRGSTSTVHYAGGTAITIGAGGGTSEDVMTWLANGLISTDEARLRLNTEILSGFGLPGPSLGDAGAFTRKACPDCGMEFNGTADAIDVSLYAHRKSGQCEQQRRKQVPAAIDEYCTCGMKFCGTPARIRVMLDEHHASGACPHSVKGRSGGFEIG